MRLALTVFYSSNSEGLKDLPYFPGYVSGGKRKGTAPRQAAQPWLPIRITREVCKSIKTWAHPRPIKLETPESGGSGMDSFALIVPQVI